MATIAIVGGGLGGLALAQALTSRGVSCEVYERDPSLAAPGRSVRIHCRPNAIASLRECLPPSVFEVLVAAQGAPDARHVYLDAQLRVTGVDERLEPELTFDTQTTREVLALDLGARLHMGKEVLKLDVAGSTDAVLWFTDGTTANHSLVIGADGLDSTTRAFAANAPPIRDVGLWSIYGNVDLDEHGEDLELPDWLNGGFAIVGDGTIKLALCLYEPVGLAGLLKRKPDLTPITVRRYLFWNVIASPGCFGPAPPSSTADPSRALDRIAAMTADFSPWVRKTIRLSSPSSIGFLAMHTSAPARESASASGLVLIGDASHPMLPAALSASVTFDDARQLGVAAAGAESAATLRRRVATAASSMHEAAFERVREAERLAGPVFGIEGSAS